MAVGAIERKFYAEFLRLLGLRAEDLPDQMDRDAWPQLRIRIAETFATKTRLEWEKVFEGTDACVVPVLSVREAPSHPHMAARRTFVESAGVLQPSPAPRFSETPGSIQGPPPRAGEHSDIVLAQWGIAPEAVASLREAGALC
jgi:alpha-methylacyl-CoA racemase